ncbi:MAG TPA: CBS domain-containing protein [Kofleriaceae bacterium]|nr:CBS domain-containing protein [Kofleriaceae bacterium]
MATLARDLMQANLVAVSPSSSLADVVHTLVVAQVSGVPVVDATGAVVAVLSATDVLQAFEQALDEDNDEDEPAELADRLSAVTAGELATPDIVFVSPDAPVADVAQLMRAESIHRVLVGTRERVEGIITAFDLLAAV